MKRFLLASLIFAVLAAVANAIPVSGDYVRIKKTDTSPVEITGYGVLRTLADGRTFIDTGTSSGTLNAPNPDVIAVGPMGDSTTISGAITLATGRTPSATNRVTIMVYPGVYAGRHYLPDYVDLIGVSREGCILKDDMENELLIVLGNSTVANLTVENTHTAVRSATCSVGGNSWLGNPTVSGKVMRVRNCTFISAGKDNYGTFGDNDIVTENCTMISPGIDNLGVTVPDGSTGHVYIDCTVETTVNRSKVLWAAGAGEASFFGCSFQTGGDSGILNLDNVPGSFGTGTLLRFFDCTFLKNGGDDLGAVIGFVNVAEGVTGDVVELNGCHYAATGITGWEAAVEIATEDLGDGDKTTGGDFDIGGSAKVGGFALLGDVTGNVMTVAGYDPLAAELTGALIYDTGPDVFEAEGFGLVTIDADGTPEIGHFFRQVNTDLWKSNMPIDAAGLSTTATQWRYFDAVACADGERTSYGLETVVGPGMGWAPNAATGATHLASVTDGHAVYFPVPYETGTILTRVAVRWQAVGDGDGVILTLQERVVTGTVTAWTTIGAAQTYTDPGAPYPVTPNIYDVADTTLADTKAYRIMVESQVAADGANLFDVGVETSKRAY